MFDIFISLKEHYFIRSITIVIVNLFFFKLIFFLIK